MFKKALFTTLILAPIITGGLIGYYGYNLYSWQYPGPDIEFTIAPGENFSKTNYRLAKSRLISNPRMFHYLSKYRQVIGQFKKGTYSIPNGITAEGLIQLFVSGKSKLTSVTIAEGKNLYEIADILERKEILNSDEFIKWCFSPDAIQLLDSSFGITGPSLEGFLFPDTYNFSPKASPKEVILAFLQNFKNKTADLNLTANNFQMSPFQIITLASIVEKETGASFERRKIAGVFHNRLKKRMRLQSDPTTIYGIWERFDGNLRRSDLLERTSYNTYKISGLPEGPISNPGIEAIKAVLNPEAHNFFYFVSKNDGTHVFSETYAQHSKQVDFFQKIRANREGKSWRDLKQ